MLDLVIMIQRERIEEDHGLNVNFYDDSKNAGIFYDGQLLWFEIDKDKLYHKN